MKSSPSSARAAWARCIARDTKLNRDVALKVLPDLFVNDPERLARFKREAQVLASLNHPNIAAIYGFEDSGPSTGSGQAAVAIVMELVEGETLAARLAQGSRLRAHAGPGLSSGLQTRCRAGAFLTPPKKGPAPPPTTPPPLP